MKTYCLQHLATHAANSPSLRVSCPICRTDYQISASGPTSPAFSWSEVLRWSATDQQLLLRHARFFFLVAPLAGSSLLAWSWLASYWEDLYYHGPGPPLVDTPTGFNMAEGISLHRSAVRWLPGVVSQLLTQYVLPEPANATDADPAFANGAGGWAAAATAEGNVPHPAGISKNWSNLYVWLQYAQWYKVLCWLLVLVLGGSEGLLPLSVREAFRVEELLLASETRAQIFIFGQFVPFVLAKARHFLVTWTGASALVRFAFYSVFTSHVEIAATLACDSAVMANLLYDWASSASNDYSLRLNLNRLRSGYFAIASRRNANAPGTAARTAAHAHAE